MGAISARGVKMEPDAPDHGSSIPWIVISGVE